MGASPAKMFGMPQPFGSSPQANNVTQAQPLAMATGPGIAAAGGFDQTQALPVAPPRGFGNGGAQNIFNTWRDRSGGGNPFVGMMMN